MKALIISVDCVMNSTTKQPYQGILEVLGTLKDSGDTVIFLSHDSSKLNKAQRLFPDGKKISRSDVRSLISQNPKVPFIFIGCHDEDAFAAATTKSLLITAGWTSIQEEAPFKYGLVVPSIDLLSQTLNILKNQTTWYFQLAVDDKTKVFALMDARTRVGVYQPQEAELIQGFHNLLKQGNRRYFDVLLYHFLAGVANNPELREIQDWAIFPSSSRKLNPEMWEFKERARYLMNGRKKEPIFLRHTAIGKSHHIVGDARIPCDRHFDSIIINPVYHGKLRNRAVCVIDDFLTNGTSFETARNLLLAEKVSKIIFVSLGTFGKSYIKQDYEMKNDVSIPGYVYKTIGQEYMTGNYNRTAINDIENLVNLLS